MKLGLVSKRWKMNQYEKMNKRAEIIINKCETLQEECRALNLEEDDILDRISNLARAYRFPEAEELMREYDSKHIGGSQFFRKKYIQGQIEKIEKKIIALKGK